MQPASKPKRAAGVAADLGDYPRVEEALGAKIFETGDFPASASKQ